MRLTKEQHQRVSEYLSAVDASLDEMPASDRNQALTDTRSRILRDLQRRGGDTISDADVDAALEELGPPAGRAHRLMAARPKTTDSFLVWPDRVWLGVCAGLARFFDTPPTVVRIVAIVIGLVCLPLLPFLLVAYILAFFAAYYLEHAPGLPPLRFGLLLKSGFRALLIGTALFAGAKLFMFFVLHVYQRFMGRALFLEGDWGWLLLHGKPLFIWTVLFCVPVALLSALPVRKAWARTLKKVSDAGLASYALALCLGIACLLVGIAVKISGEVRGDADFDTLKALF